MKGIQRGASLFWRDAAGAVLPVLVLDKGPERRWWCKLPEQTDLIALPARELYATEAVALAGGL